MVRALVAAVVACAACQGQPAGPVAVGSGSASAAAVPGPGDAGASDARGSAAAGREPDAGGKPDEPEAVDPGRVISELGAVPAWQAVVDRAQLLGRRGQHGVVYGRVGPAILVPGPPPPPPPATPAPVAPVGSGVDAGMRPGVAVAAGAAPGPAGAPPGPAGAAPGPAGAPPGPAVAPPGPAVAPRLVASPYVWLVDDTEGNGSLGIRIALGGKAREGDRIAAGGAWQLDTERRWFWKPDAVQPLPAAPPSDLKEPPPPAPSHAIATGDLPPGARTASVARDNDLVYFQIVGLPPATDGDGWQVADQLGSPTVLVMNLPGERPSYGGQDMRAADERWQLRRGQTYWVRIGKLHRRGDKPPAVNARTAPIRVP
jgi:hypothetical protein